VIALDIHPTAVAAAGAPTPKGLDGVNLLPNLKGTMKTPPHAELYWRFGASRAIQQGEWKLVQVQGGQTELHNLAKYIGERTNLAAAEPARLKSLEETYAAWNAQPMEPRWRTERQGERKGKRKKKKA
jgi:arylsulfatase A-like enzyme